MSDRPQSPPVDQHPATSDVLSPIESAHREYNAALTRLDGAIQEISRWPERYGAPDVSQLGRINAEWNILPGGTPPLGTGVRGRLAGFVWRLLGPVLQQQLTFNAALVDHVNRDAESRASAERAMAEAVATMREGFEGLVRFESRLVQFLQRITPLIDTRERAIHDAIAELRTVTGIAQRAAASTQRQVERLAGELRDGAPQGATPPSPAAGPPRPAVSQPESNAYKYVGFEDRFRGSESEIRTRLEAYVPYFTGASDVLDIGCGRGEFLDLMRQHNIRARGLDLNGAMVEVCRERGLDAVHGDALGYLASLPDGALGGLIAVQVVEHLDPDYLVTLLQTAFHKLRPGSTIALETINPTCWVAFFESYIRDLTHVRPVHPETLQYLLLASGFNRVEIVYRSPVGDKLQAVSPRQDSGEALDELVAAFNRNVERLNSRMFTYLDYAAVGVRT
jgi:O-antigen chain-terminating methyltransferase